MIVNFHPTQFDRDRLCDDLRDDGVAMIDGARVKCRTLGDEIKNYIDIDITTKEVTGADGNWYYFLICLDQVPFSFLEIDAPLRLAIAQWLADGSPLPHAIRV